jgi:polyisoprenoid-binding protein YceI
METNWKIDTLHSEIGFKVRHLMISNVVGKFNDFADSAVLSNDDFSSAKFNFEASIDSINTGVADRDGHLKSTDFFDSASFPKLTFHSESITKKSDSDFEIAGLISIKGVEKPMVLSVDYAGIAVDPYGQTKAGMALTGKIKRSDFGLTWSAVTEAGNVVLSDDIHLNCEIQLVKQ